MINQNCIVCSVVLSIRSDNQTEMHKMYKFAPILLLVYSVQSANILCYFGFPSYSHQITFQPIWKELANRGHQVTVITPNPLKDKSIKNLREIDLHDISYNVMEKNNVYSQGVDEEVASTDSSLLIKSAIEVMTVQMEHSEVKDLIQNKKNLKFDLIIVEMALPHVYMLKEVYNCPMIMTLSMPLHYNLDETFGNVNHPVISPDINLPFSRNLTFFERAHSLAHNTMVRFMIWRMRFMFSDLIEHHYGRKYSPNVMNEGSIVLTNVNPVLHPRKPTVPNIIEFSGIHIHPPKPLPNDLQQYLDTSKQGVIYMSLGSNIKSAALGKKKINLILETFSKLPYNVLWKFEDEDLPNKPKNVRIQKWFPQLDLLRHPNVKLFITQGGMQSLDDAMYTKTPVVTIPFVRDQHGNSKKVIDIGMGLSIQNSKMTVDKFRDVILEALSERFVKRAEELYDIVTDQPVPALNKTIWWIEYVLRHKDLSHLKTAALTLPWYQYYMLDVIGAFLLVFISALYIIYFIIKSFIRWICPSNKVKIN